MQMLLAFDWLVWIIFFIYLFLPNVRASLTLLLEISSSFSVNLGERKKEHRFIFFYIRLECCVRSRSAPSAKQRQP